MALSPILPRRAWRTPRSAPNHTPTGPERPSSPATGARARVWIAGDRGGQALRVGHPGRVARLRGDRGGARGTGALEARIQAEMNEKTLQAPDFDRSKSQRQNIRFIMSAALMLLSGSF